MILVADSGSTKTQWGVVDNHENHLLVNTPGINPFLMSIEEIESVIRPIQAEVKLKEHDAIFFFGAGCATMQQQKNIRIALFNIFKCTNINVDSDLIGTCYALSGKRPAIIAILGTGSNSCLWDGETILDQTPSLGYVLGDEGAGVDLGRKLVADFLKHQMPKELRVAFTEQYDVSTEIVLERIYKMPLPNQYLAGFAPFLKQYINHEYCYNSVINGFNSFLERNIVRYENATSIPIHFCGSIGFNFKDLLTIAVQTAGLQIGKIEKEYLPMLLAFIRDQIELNK